MNSVSWFIYIAQVSNSLGALFIVLGVIGVILLGIYAVACTIATSFETDSFKPHLPQLRYVAAVISLLLVGNLMPARDTMYAIAASQVGEQMLKTEIVTDATRALHEWIKKQIEPAAKK